jgi:c-di-GMP-binding flagellar brake protein YcgR
MSETHEQSTEKFMLLEESRLQIGDVVSLQPIAGEGTLRYSVKLIGMTRDRSVLVGTPMVDGHYLLMKEGQGFILRGFSGKSAYAFATQILKSMNTPYPYLHLSYPREVKSLVVRKGSRADVNVICAVVDVEDARKTAAGHIINISAGGALLVFRDAFCTLDQTLIVKFKTMINGIEALIELKGVVRAVNVDHSADAALPHRVGVQFMDIAPQDSIPLLAFVYQALLEQSFGV